MARSTILNGIRASLESKGHRFRTKCDSEVILYLYQEYGLGCFEHLRGEFAFLLYDKSKQLFIAARDRFGIKPLYLSRLSDGFVFGSEIKAIFASKFVAPKLNAAGFDPLNEQDPSDDNSVRRNRPHSPCVILLDPPQDRQIQNQPLLVGGNSS